MKNYGAVAAVLAAASTAFAEPSRTENLRPRASSSTLTSITVKGNAFFKGDDRFYIRGIDYQPGGSSDVADPISDADSCKRDIKYFQELGLNTIRVYTVDNTADHDECMNALADAGIYLVLDVNTPKYSLNRADPHTSYNSVYLQSVFATIDSFAGYNNTLAFFSGNEVINDDTTTSCAPYVKAVTRDMRNYIKSMGYRQIPVGYSAADVDSNRLEMAEYMNCGSSEERSDFFAFNDYSWCDPSSFTQSGWDQKVKNFTGYGIPLFLSEYGCITNTRTFEEVAALYNTEMTGVYSGGLVYEYSMEANGYGVVNISSDGDVTTGDQFTYLKTALSNTTDPSGDGGYNSTGGASGCPAYSATWNVTTDALPSIPSPAEAYMSSGAGTGPGLSGAGSQTAGTEDNTSQSNSTSTSDDGSSSSSTSSASSTHKGTAGHLGPMDMSPFYVAGIALFATMFGAALL